MHGAGGGWGVGGEAGENILGGQQWSFGDVGINTFLRSEGDTADQYMSVYANYSPILKRVMEVKEQLSSSSEVMRSG